MMSRADFGSVTARRLRTIPWTAGSSRRFVATNLLDDPAVQGIVLNLRAVTEPKSARDIMSQLASIVESSDDGIIGMSLDGRIESWNKGAERIYGYTFEEVRGCNISM